jgi:hypothetical protein
MGWLGSLSGAGFVIEPVHFALLLLIVFRHPMPIQNVEEVKEALTLEKGVNTLEVTICLNVRKRDGTCAVHGYATAVVQVGE